MKAIFGTDELLERFEKIHYFLNKQKLESKSDFKRLFKNRIIQLNNGNLELFQKIKLSEKIKEGTVLSKIEEFVLLVPESENEFLNLIKEIIEFGDDIDEIPFDYIGMSKLKKEKDCFELDNRLLKNEFKKKKEFLLAHFNLFVLFLLFLNLFLTLSQKDFIALRVSEDYFIYLKLFVLSLLILLILGFIISITFLNKKRKKLFSLAGKEEFKSEFIKAFDWEGVAFDLEKHNIVNSFKNKEE